MWTLRLMLVVLGVSSFVSSAFADENTIQVINHGVAAFQKRLEMIDRAEKTIDVEYFIYNADEAGRLFTQALVRRKEALKKQGKDLRIRMIIDASGPTLQINRRYVEAFKAHGIEVRYYNDASLITDFKNAQFRDHRKLIVIDGKEAITGSRNIADEYFDLSKEFNFRDRDIWVEGPVAAEMGETFEAYWNHPITVVPAPMYKPYTIRSKRRAKEAADFFVETAYDRSLRGAIRNVGRPLLADENSVGSCGKLTYAGDLPGLQSKATRKVLPQIYERMGRLQSGDTLYVESPYFIIHDPKAKNAMAFLKERGINGVLLTNSLASTDAFYVASNFFPKVSFYESMLKGQMYAFRGDTPKDTPFILVNKRPLTEGAVWGIHSKTFVFGDDSFAIGTFNLDPRSANLNSEMMLFCEGNADPAKHTVLADYVLSDIRSRITGSDPVGPDGKLPNGKTIFDNVGFWKKLKFKIAIKPSEWFVELF